MTEPSLDNDLPDAGAIVEIKKELSDTSHEPPDSADGDYVAPNDGIFEMIPFMAKLLSNLKCSFYSRHGEIIVASIELTSVHELVNRLIANRIQPNRMNCCLDSSFTLTIPDDQFSHPAASPLGTDASGSSSSVSILRFLPNMAIVTEGSDLALHIEAGEIEIRSISYESLASLMTRLKQYDIRPKQVDSMKNSVFSLVFNSHSFIHVENMLQLFPMTIQPGDPVAIRRPRICPNYLRDYVVEHKEEPLGGLEFMPALLSRAAFPAAAAGAAMQKNTPTGGSSGGQSSDEAPVAKRGRGRPRIRPEPGDCSFDSSSGKKPRGRPRRSDVVPSIVARPNSFINIQPKGMSFQEFESCCVKFLESDIAALRQQK